MYSVAYDVVTANLRRISRNHKLLVKPEAEVDAAVEAMYPSRAMEFMRYAADFSRYGDVLPGLDWGAPARFDVEAPKDRAAFMLDGVFREGCEKQWRLEEPLTSRIDRDVYSRVYALIRMGLLPSSATR